MSCRGFTIIAVRFIVVVRMIAIIAMVIVIAIVIAKGIIIEIGSGDSGNNSSNTNSHASRVLVSTV